MIKLSVGPSPWLDWLGTSLVRSRRPSMSGFAGSSHESIGCRGERAAGVFCEAEAGMMWGDRGSLYWLMRPDDLAARRFGVASFTWQCT